MVSIPDSERDRFWARVDKSRGPDACWEWQGTRNEQGYGNAYISGLRASAAHRIAYTLAYGSIAPGMVIRHYICDNPPCCNPSHLREGTPAQNAQDRVDKGRSSKGAKHAAAVRAGMEKWGGPAQYIKAKARPDISSVITQSDQAMPEVSHISTVSMHAIDVPARPTVMKSKLRVLVAERATREGRALSMRRLSEESGASIATVNRMANNTIKRIPVDDLEMICRYLDCEVGELLQMEEA